MNLPGNEFSKQYTNIERETIVIFNESEKTAEIYSASPRIINQLLTLCEKFPDVYKVIRTVRDKDRKITGSYFSCPKGFIKFKRPRILSEKQKEVVEMLKLGPRRPLGG